MHKNPPRPLCLPELLSDPQTKADYIQANPPRYGPNSRPPSTYEGNSVPPSPTSVHGSDYYRRSRTASPPPPSSASLTSSHTSLSIHNGSGSSMIDSMRTSIFSQSLDKEKHSSKTWSISDIPFGEVIAKPRATWSNTFKTKSWFGSVAAVNEAKQIKPPHQIEIKLSPSMIAAAESEAGRPLRPLSSPFPTGGSVTLSPRIGVGLQYYTEKNPAPLNARKQLPDPIAGGSSEPIAIATLSKSIPPTLEYSIQSPPPGIKISDGDT